MVANAGVSPSVLNSAHNGRSAHGEKRPKQDARQIFEGSETDLRRMPAPCLSLFTRQIYCLRISVVLKRVVKGHGFGPSFIKDL